MANGRQMKEANIQAFRSWVAAHSDEELKEYAYRGQLSRTEIAKECEFGKSALLQNPTIKLELEALENWLRYKSLLPPSAGCVFRGTLDHNEVETSDRTDPSTFSNDDRVEGLQLENASLKAALERHKKYILKFGKEICVGDAEDASMKGLFKQNGIDRFEGYIIVSRIRSQNPKGFGGCIFSGFEVNAEGKRVSPSKLLVVKAKAALVQGEVTKGERWRVKGVVSNTEQKNFNSLSFMECTIEPEEPIIKERETGDQIVSLVAKTQSSRGLGV